jgi:hypothetical protein
VAVLAGGILALKISCGLMLEYRKQQIASDVAAIQASDLLKVT